MYVQFKSCFNLFLHFFRKETPTQVFSCEFSKFFKNIYFEKCLLLTSEINQFLQKLPKQKIPKNQVLSCCTVVASIGSSRPEVFRVKGIIKNFEIFTGEHLFLGPFLIELQARRPAFYAFFVRGQYFVQYGFM